MREGRVGSAASRHGCGPSAGMLASRHRAVALTCFSLLRDSLCEPMTQADKARLIERTYSVKRRFLAMYKAANAGHIGCSLSCAEMLVCFRCTRKRPTWGSAGSSRSR
jgi:hypothetical protein